MGTPRAPAWVCIVADDRGQVREKFTIVGHMGPRVEAYERAAMGRYEVGVILQVRSSLKPQEIHDALASALYAPLDERALEPLDDIERARWA